MTSTLELLTKALEKKSASAWSRDYNITPGTFTNAKKAGRLSPMLAGNIAMDLGEDANRWMAVAALEAERDSPLRDRLRDTLLLRNQWLLKQSKLIAKAIKSTQKPTQRVGFTLL